MATEPRHIRLCQTHTHYPKALATWRKRKSLRSFLQGRCVGKVPLAVHNLKLQTTLQLYKVPVWPFSGAVAIKNGRSMLVINKWCYLGTANDHDELDNLAQYEDLDFDPDIYKLVKKALTGVHKTNVVKLSRTQED